MRQKITGSGIRFALLFLLLAAAAQTTAARTIHRRLRKESAAEAMRAVMDRQVVAWNKGDLEAFMSGYWNSPNLTFFSSTSEANGWQAALDRYRKTYQSEGNEMGVLDFSNLKFEVLGPDAAFVRGHWHLKLTKGDQSGHFTLIFKRFPDGWKIIHDHTS